MVVALSRIVFCSDLSAVYKDSLNELLFFNREQSKFARGIIASIDKYGLPIVSEKNDKICISLEKFEEVQTIFALTKEDSAANAPEELIGVMLFLRESSDCIALIHIAVKEKYTFLSSKGQSYLATELLFKLKAIAKQLKNIEHIKIYYHNEEPKLLRIKKKCSN